LGRYWAGRGALTIAASTSIITHKGTATSTQHPHPTGVTDHLAQDERHALAITRDIIANLGPQCNPNAPAAPPAAGSGGWEEPLFPIEELRGIVPAERQPWDMRGLLARLLDGSRFEEFRSNYGRTLITGGPWGWGLGLGVGLGAGCRPWLVWWGGGGLLLPVPSHQKAAKPMRSPPP